MSLSPFSFLQQNGFDVRPILSPAVQKGKERLRICIHVFNTSEQIRGLCDAINKNFKSVFLPLQNI